MMKRMIMMRKTKVPAHSTMTTKITTTMKKMITMMKTRTMRITTTTKKMIMMMKRKRKIMMITVEIAAGHHPQAVAAVRAAGADLLLPAGAAAEAATVALQPWIPKSKGASLPKVAVLHMAAVPLPVVAVLLPAVGLLPARAVAVDLLPPAVVPPQDKVVAVVLLPAAVLHPDRVVAAVQDVVLLPARAVAVDLPPAAVGADNAAATVALQPWILNNKGASLLKVAVLHMAAVPLPVVAGLLLQAVVPLPARVVALLLRVVVVPRLAATADAADLLLPAVEVPPLPVRVAAVEGVLLPAGVRPLQGAALLHRAGEEVQAGNFRC